MLQKFNLQEREKMEDFMQWISPYNNDWLFQSEVADAIGSGHGMIVTGSN